MITSPTGGGGSISTRMTVISWCMAGSVLSLATACTSDAPEDARSARTESGPATPNISGAEALANSSSATSNEVTFLKEALGTGGLPAPPPENVDVLLDRSDVVVRGTFGQARGLPELTRSGMNYMAIDIDNPVTITGDARSRPVSMLVFVANADPGKAASDWNAAVARGDFLTNDSTLFVFRSAATTAVSTKPGKLTSALTTDGTLYWPTSYGSFFLDGPDGLTAPAAPEGHGAFFDDVRALGTVSAAAEFFAKRAVGSPGGS